MEASSLPVWAQAAGLIAIALVSAIVGVFKYLKTETQEGGSPSTSSSGTVLSASFIDSKLLKELIEALREHQEESGRDSKRVLRTTQDLREAIQENTEALIVQTDTTTNLLKFVNNRKPVVQEFS